MSDMSIRTFQTRFKNGDFKKRYPGRKSWEIYPRMAEEERALQCEAGWYDWFCKDSSLAGKTQKLGSVVSQLRDSAKVNLDTMYVFFKNNCPMGPLYDDFRICDLKEGSVLYCCSYKSPHEDDGVVWAVYGKENDFAGVIATFPSSHEMVKWFNESKAD